MDKKQVAAALEEIAVLMELSGENPFKSRSYVNVARALDQFNGDIDMYVREKRLREIKGVGDAIEQKITELVTTGKLEYLEELRAKFPPSLFQLFNIGGLGPKRVKVLYDELGIDSLEKLEAACRENRIAGLKGFSAKMQEKCLQGLLQAAEKSGQHLCSEGWRAALALVEHLKVHPSILRMDIAGSLRRRKEVIKDVDIVAASDAPKALMQHFVSAPSVAGITGQGDTKSSVVLGNGVGADLRVVTEEQFPYALLHFTGSKEHNVGLRQRAKERGLKLNEYGLFREADGALVKCRTEEAIYKKLGMPFIPPELREDLGEFMLEQTPRLVEKEDLRGIIHCHTTYSDGAETLETMAATAQQLGYAYIVISDHSQTAAYAGGLKPPRVLQQQREIDALNEAQQGIRVLKGIESDILADGRLDYEEDILKTFEIVIASCHSKLDMPDPEATNRVVKAIENPYTTILGHATGRLLLSRAGLPLDMERIFDACVANRVAVEINASPRRLDVDWRHVRRGRDKGVMFSIGPDAHRLNEFGYIPYGLGIARKGWLGPEHVLNCLSAEELLAWRG